jgi:hypothetical protein
MWLLSLDCLAQLRGRRKLRCLQWSLAWTGPSWTISPCPTSPSNCPADDSWGLLPNQALTTTPGSDCCQEGLHRGCSPLAPSGSNAMSRGVMAWAQGLCASLAASQSSLIPIPPWGAIRWPWPVPQNAEVQSSGGCQSWRSRPAQGTTIGAAGSQPG